VLPSIRGDYAGTVVDRATCSLPVFAGFQPATFDFRKEPVDAVWVMRTAIAGRQQTSAAIARAKCLNTTLTDGEFAKREPLGSNGNHAVSLSGASSKTCTRVMTIECEPMPAMTDSVPVLGRRPGALRRSAPSGLRPGRRLRAGNVGLYRRQSGCLSSTRDRTRSAPGTASAARLRHRPSIWSNGTDVEHSSNSDGSASDTEATKP